MQFVLKGFSEDMGCRIFAFEGIAADRTHITFTVKADLALSRSYGIRLQELPLLCRILLDGHQLAEDERAFTYTEEDMRLFYDCEKIRSNAAKQNKQKRSVALASGSSLGGH